MKRRKFFKKTLAITSVISIGTVSYLTFFSDPPELKYRPFLNEFLSEDDIAEIINEYLSKNKKFDNINIDSEDEIANVIKDDFIEDKIIICKGWVLSQTEIKYLIQKSVN
ncbi:MAG: hypothetical protein ACR2MT_13500 [Aurantibacter sp.]